VTYLEIYTKQFDQDRYSNNAHAPDHDYAVNAIPDSAKSILDIGSGRGIFLRRVKAKFPGMELKSADLDKFHDLDIPFLKINLADRASQGVLSKLREPLVTCIGVLEHLREREMPAAVAAMRAACTGTAIITVANHIDKGYGDVDLHLTLQPAPWWRALLEKHFAVVGDLHVYGRGRGICFTCRVA
jgi:2-polyprenyl-3-methyl-5-hydroxy-6-metoxy-1,4-benzoquinol methylase